MSSIAWNEYRPFPKEITTPSLFLAPGTTGVPSDSMQPESAPHAHICGRRVSLGTDLSFRVPAQFFEIKSASPVERGGGDFFVSRVPKAEVIPRCNRYGFPAVSHKTSMTREQEQRRERLLAKELVVSCNEKVPDWRLANVGISRDSLPRYVLLQKGCTAAAFIDAFEGRFLPYRDFCLGVRVCGSGATACIFEEESQDGVADIDISYYLDLPEGDTYNGAPLLDIIAACFIDAFYHYVDWEKLPDIIQELSVERRKVLLFEAYLGNYFRPSFDGKNEWMLMTIGTLDVRFTIRIAHEVDCTAASYQVDLHGDYYYCLDRDEKEAREHYHSRRFVCRNPHDIGMARALHRLSKKKYKYSFCDLKPFCPGYNCDEFMRVIVRHLEKDQAPLWEKVRVSIAALLAMLAGSSLRDEKRRMFCEVMHAVYAAVSQSQCCGGNNRQVVLKLLHNVCQQREYTMAYQIYSLAEVMKIRGDDLWFQKIISLFLSTGDALLIEKAHRRAQK